MVTAALLRMRSLNRAVLHEEIPLSSPVKKTPSFMLEDIEILEKVGEGNFGEVYKGKSMGLTVALKTIKDEKAKQEFESECRILR